MHLLQFFVKYSNFRQFDISLLTISSILIFFLSFYVHTLSPQFSFPTSVTRKIFVIFVKFEISAILNFYSVKFRSPSLVRTVNENPFIYLRTRIHFFHRVTWILRGIKIHRFFLLTTHQSIIRNRLRSNLVQA